MNLKEFHEMSERDYALSTVRGTMNTYQYWVRQGYSEKHAMDNAMKYAVGQVKSIISTDRLGQSHRNFELVASISATIAKVLERESNAKTVIPLEVIQRAK